MTNGLLGCSDIAGIWHGYSKFVIFVLGVHLVGEDIYH